MILVVFGWNATCSRITLIAGFSQPLVDLHLCYQRHIGLECKLQTRSYPATSLLCTMSRSYTTWSIPEITTSVVISNLLQGRTYYFAATTYTLAGLESDYSTESLVFGPQAKANRRRSTISQSHDQ